MTNSEHQEEEIDKAPILGSWKAIYLWVMVIFLVMTGLFYWFTVSFNA